LEDCKRNVDVVRFFYLKVRRTIFGEESEDECTLSAL